MIFYFLFTTFLAGLTLAKVPDYMQVCGRKNPQLNECVVDSVMKLKSRIAEGFPDLDAPSVEPMSVDFLTIAKTRDLNVSAEDVLLYGLSGFERPEVNVDLKGMKIDLKLFFKKINLRANYDVSTRVVVPISGKGPINIVADDITAKVTLKFQLADHKGQKYLYFPSMTTQLTIKDYTSHFMPQGEGSNGALAEGINSALNESRQEIIETIIPNLEKAISERVLVLANKICKHFTYDELFPDRE